MAGEWIKMATCLSDKPEVFQLADILDIDTFSVVGRLHALWSWADKHTINGNAISVTNVTLDKITHCPGFADALRKVGWLEGRDGLLTFPRFERHNGQTAKNRALTNDRVTRLRRNVSSVTESLPEKRREDSKQTPPHARPTSLDEALAYGLDKPGYKPDVIRHWFASRDSQGWIKGNDKPVTNWRSDLDAWVMDQRNHTPQQSRRSAKALYSEAQRDQARTGLPPVECKRFTPDEP